VVRESLQLCSDQRNFQLDFQIIADQESPGFKRRIPRETEIALLNSRGCGRAILAFPKRSFLSAEGT
jgi:hypothetical protein